MTNFFEKTTLDSLLPRSNFDEDLLGNKNSNDMDSLSNGASGLLTSFDTTPDFTSSHQSSFLSRILPTNAPVNTQPQNQNNASTTSDEESIEAMLDFNDTDSQSNSLVATDTKTENNSNDTTNITNNNNTSTKTETPPPPEKRMTEAALEALLKNPKSIDLEQFQSTPSFKAVCSALTKTQGPILKFSEIFGPLAEPFVPSKKRKVNFAKPQNESRDSPIGEEELWAEYDSADDNEMSDDNNDMQIQDEDAVGQALTTDPTKKPPESLERVLPVSTSEAFSLAAQQHWEASIVWTDNNFDSDIDMGSLQQELFAKPPPSVTAPPPKPRTSTVHWGEINTAPVVAEAPAQETKPAAVAFKPMVSSVPPPLTSGPLGVPSSPAPLFRSASQPDLKKLTSMPSLMRMPSSASIAKMPMKPNPRLKTPLNDELEEGTWADTIVWDDKKPPAKPPLTQLIIDFNDTDVFPENPEKSQIFQTVGSQSQDVSKTKKRKLEETEAEELDRFNISNDTFYKTLNRANKMPEKFGKSKILHSEPAWRLSLVKTHLVDKDLEDFHHPKMTIPLDEPQKIHLVPNDQVYESTQSQNRSEAMRKKSDMSGKDGRIVLMEYVEERPPILMNVGMGTKAKNFYRKRNANENPLLRFDDGENVLMDVAEKSPFVLGDVNPGQTVQALDNNMFIAPVFRHVVPETDFLVVRQGKKLYLREIPAIYTVGQLQPRMEVYQPNSRPANDFVKKRLQAYIHRMFMKNSTLQVKISDIMTLFPGNSETAIRKRLKDCADFQRGGGDTGSWVVTDQSKLPNEDDLRRNVPPEHVCLYESMLAGMYYLREAGVTRFTTTSPQFTAALQQIDSEGNEILKRAAHRLEEELLLSPWNLTFNFRMYTEKKGLLQLSGLGDPSGRGEGFSYLRMPMKNNQQSKKKKELQKTQVTGTDADLRKLSLDNARKVLLHFGVSESEIARLGRWERIALVRKKSSEVAASGEGGLTKFARGSRYSMHQQQLQYKEQEQMIWENQSRALSDPTPDLSDEEDEEEMEDFEKDLETMLDTASKKRKRNEQKEKYEEAEKEEYEKFAQELKGNAASSHAPQPGTYVPTSLDAISNAKKYLKRKVVVKNPDGTKSEKIEWITDPEQVEAILQAEREKIKNRRLPRAIPSQMTPEEAEERKKLHREKRRLQEQLRRLRQNQQKQEALVESIYAGSVSPDDRRIPALVKCTKCGQHGHNRTNHSCPLYNERDTKESKKDRLQPLSKDNSLSGSKEGLIVRIKKNEVTSRSSKEDLEVNYLVQQSGKNAKRRRRDPQVEFSNVLERLVERIKTMPQAVPFLKPVAKNDKWAPDYHKIIRNPIDLSTIKQRLGKLVHYKSRGDFLKDMRLMKENCYIYNQHRNPHLLPMVDQVYAECESFFHENDEEIAQLEREIAEGVDEVMSPQTPRSYSNPTSPQMSPQNDWLHGHRPTTPSQMSPPMSPGVAMSPPPGQMSPTADSRAMSPSQFFNADPEDGEIDVVNDTYQINHCSNSFIRLFEIAPTNETPNFFRRHYSSKPDIPVINFSKLTFPLQSSSQLQQISKQEQHDAFSTFGFFYLTGHGIPSNVERDLVSFSRKLFDLPLDTKMSIHLAKGGIAWRGYMPLEGERTHGRPDRKEGLYLAPEHSTDHPKVIAGVPSFGKNQFPDAALPGIRPAALKYLDEVTQVGHHLMEVLSVSLGLAPSYIHDNLTKDPVILFRLWNYPPQKNPPVQEPIGIDDHTDYGLVTILKQELPGLQFKSPVYGWMDVPPIEGTLICSAGDLLDRITEGRYKSRPHRVVLSHTDLSNKPRLSFPCFFDPGWDATMKALPLGHLPPLIDGEDAEARWKNTAYKTLTGQYWQYLAKKLSKVFPQLSGFQFEGARDSSTRFHIKIPE